MEKENKLTMIKVDVETWNEFKRTCAINGTTMTFILNKLVKEFLETEKEKDKENDGLKQEI